ncbi:MAG: polysaccharide pyruvyl transferase family protein [Anaerolineaceae bacterium]|nr:polysaccharide pyruvyl transferase family protein [Anaerolineaceae bacterium]
MGHNPTIAIIGGTFWGNRGAESMLSTTIGLLRRSNPGARFVVFSYYPKKDRELVRDERIAILSCKPISLVTHHLLGALIASLLLKIGLEIPKGKFFKISRHLAKSDVLLDIGGITFSDGREKFLIFNILTIWPAMLLNTPVIKMAQALGPFENKINRIFANIFLKRCNFVFARGEKTGEFLRDLKFPKEKTNITPDIAFLYELDFSLSEENEKAVSKLVKKLARIKETGKKVIVFSPSILVEKRSAKKGFDYLEGFINVIRSLDVMDCHFVVIPNASRAESKKAHNNDLLTIGRMKSRLFHENLSKDNVDLIDFDINTRSIRNIIGQANLLVTSRYHAMISGLCLSIPTLVIGWSHKYWETLSYFGLDEYALDYGRDMIHLITTVEDMLSKEKEISDQITQALPEVKKKSLQQFSYLEKVIN